MLRLPQRPALKFTMRPLKFSPRTRAFLRVLLSHYITNGITACLGLLVISLIVENWLGAYAASLATVGVIAVTPPDVAAPRRGKLRTMMLPFIAGVPVFYIVQLLNGRHLELGIFLTFFSFLAFLAMAWGKRGIPVAMGMMFTAIFSIASHRPGAESAALQSTLYFSIGAGLYVIWATLANLALNARYRALAMADVLISLADLIRNEARQFRHQRACDTDECEALLSQLLKAQAALADQMQATRDIVLESPRTPFRQRIAGMLVIVIDIRDQLLASELDLDSLRTHPRHRHALAQMRSVLDELADEVDALADALFLGYRPRPAIDRRTRIATIRSTHDYEQDGFSLGPTPAMLVRGIAHRIGHINDEILRLSRTARGEQMPNLAIVRANWQMFVSPTAWSWAPFFSVWGWKTPQMRHAIRAALAMGTGYAVSINLPWGGLHDYWILLTIAVVLRGSLSQTLERRNQRVAGTLVGCLLTMGLLGLHPASIVLLVVMTVAQGAAHGFAQRRYLVTSVAGTTLGLIQAYMLAYGDSSHATFTLFERMADTLLGAVIAWAFAYILPSWERGQIPAVVQRTIDAQIRHAKLALDPEQLKSVEDTPELEWRLARREAFDSLSALVQATQRSLSEPRAVRPPIEALQYMQVHCYQLLAQLSAVKALLVLRRDRLNLPEATAALENAIERIERKLGSLPIAPLNDSTAASTLSDQVILPDPFETEITPWLLRRLDASTNIAIQIRDDASRVLQILDWSAGQHLVECDAA